MTNTIVVDDNCRLDVESTGVTHETTSQEQAVGKAIIVSCPAVYLGESGFDIVLMRAQWDRQLLVVLYGYIL